MSVKLKSWLLLLVLSLIWGSSFLLIKTGLFDSNGNERLFAGELAALRVSFATLALSPLLIVSLKSVSKKDVKYLAVVGICGNGLPAFLFSYAETRIDSSVAGMLNALVPLFVIIIGALFFHFTVKKHHVVGIGIAVLGALFIAKEQLVSVDIEEETVLPLLAVVLATICYATSLNVIKYKLKDLKSIAITSVSFLIISPVAFLYLLASGVAERVQYQDDINEGIVAVLVLSVVGTAMALLLFNQLIKMSSPVFASSVTYFIPVVAMLIGFFFGEQITETQILGMMMLIIGVLVANGVILKQR